MTAPQIAPQTAPDPVHQRLAGLLYLAIIVLGVGAEGVVRGAVLDLHGNPQAGAAIAAAEGTFRLAMLADLGMALADVALAVLFFGFFRTLAPGLALAAMAFRLVQTAVIAGGILTLEAALRLSVAGEPGSSALVLALHGVGYDIGLAFFGINALLMGVLIRRAAWIHSAFGWGLTASGAVYLAGSVLRVAAPEAAELFAPAYAVPLLAETALCLRLLLAARLGGARGGGAGAGRGVHRPTG